MPSVKGLKAVWPEWLCFQYYEVAGKEWTKCSRGGNSHRYDHGCSNYKRWRNSPQTTETI